MPFTSIAPISSPSWALDTAWPSRYNQAATAVGIEVGVPIAPIISRNFGAFGRVLLSVGVSGATFSEAMTWYNGMWAYRNQTTGVNVGMRALGELPIIPAIGAAATFPAGVQTNPTQRANWFSLTFAQQAGAVWGSETGFAILNSDRSLVVQNWPGAGGQPNFGGFGIFGDGAGGLAFRAYDNVTPGPANVLTNVPLPAPGVPGAWRTVEFFLTGGSPSRDSTLDVYLDGVALPGAMGLRFNNLPGGVWWDPAVDRMMQFAWRQASVGAGNGQYIASWRLRQGWFTRDGAELTD